MTYDVWRRYILLGTETYIWGMILTCFFTRVIRTFVSVYGITICWISCMIYRQTSIISRTLVENKLVDHSDIFGASPTLHLHAPLNKWVRQLQVETRNIQVLRFGATYIRGLTVHWIVCIVAVGKISLVRLKAIMQKMKNHQLNLVYALKPRQDGGHFADDTFKLTFFNWCVCILIEVSLKFVPKDSIDHKPALVQIMS